MPIHFIVNDPGVPGALPEVVSPIADPPAGRVGFSSGALPAEQAYSPESPDFVVWQAREAALRTVSVFEDIAGPLQGWMGRTEKKALQLHADAGEDLNAYYDRQSISFFHLQIGNKTFFSGASSDVVAHETGHAILDALRPGLWDVKMFEVAAFHEGFGDCIAIMLALSDAPTRTAILQNDPNLTGANFVEATAEELSQGIGRAYGPNHNAAAPRHALNTFRWSFPQALPKDGKPNVLIEEIHSFGQLTSGCFYEVVREIFLVGPKGEAGLWQACQTATKLLAEAAASAPIVSRFLESIGQTMILADRRLNPSPDGTGLHEPLIRTAFDRHGITLSVKAFFAPRAMLAGPRRGARTGAGQALRPAALVSAKVKEQLRSVLGAESGAQVTPRSFGLADDGVAQVVIQKTVDLTGLDHRLENVTCTTPQEAIVGQVDQAQALLGRADAGAVISSEVRAFVEVLLRRDLIDFDKKARPKAKRRRSQGGSGATGLEGRPTYALRRTRSGTTLERIGFACCCRRPRFSCLSV